MFESEVLQLGPLQLPLTWLAGVLWIWVGGKTAQTGISALKRQGFSGHVLEASFIYLVVWKWSPVLFDPLSYLRNPAALLFASGSDKGVGVALVVAGIYLFLIFRKKKGSLPLWLDAGAITGIIAFGGYSLLFARWGEMTDLPWGWSAVGGKYRYHPIHIYRVFLLAAVGLWWWRWRQQLEEGWTFAWSATVTGTGLLLISLMDYFPLRTAWGLSWSQTTYACLALVGVTYLTTGNQTAKE